MLATGDELVPVHALPGPTQIRDSNLHSLEAQIELAGGEPVPLPIAPDEPRELRELIALAFEHDLALFSGGVSMGKYDLVRDALEEFQAEVYIGGARIQPGKPIVFGEAEATVKAEAVSSQRPAILRRSAVCLFSVCRAIPYRRWSPLNCLSARCFARSPEANLLPCCSFRRD